MKKNYIKIINQIQKVRSKNNVNWMNILKLAFKLDPKNASKIMKKIKSFIFILFVSILVGNCSTLKEGFINDKKKGTDEFLVEKKQPLIMPPNFEKLPLPNTTLDIESDKEQKVSSLEKMLKTSSNEEQSDNKKDTTSSIESLILKEIKK